MANEITKVVFRTDKKNGEVTAFFPELPGDNNPSNMACYAEIGQHGISSSEYPKWECRASELSEYRQLQNELERIGYNLKIAKRFTLDDFKARRDALERVGK